VPLLQVWLYASRAEGRFNGHRYGTVNDPMFFASGIFSHQTSVAWLSDTSFGGARTGHCLLANTPSQSAFPAGTDRLSCATSWNRFCPSKR
jgi:hypothetical protein